MVNQMLTILVGAVGRILFIPLVVAFVLVATGTMDQVVEGGVQLAQTFQDLNETMEAVNARR